MNHFAHLDLIRVQQSEMCAAAEQHRLVTAARRTGRPGWPRIMSVRRMASRAMPRRVRLVAGAEPRPPRFRPA